MSSDPGLSLALRWLATDQGLEPAELARLAGVSPGTATAFLERPHAPSQTWLTLLGALGCRLELRAPARTIAIALPRSAAKRREHERRQWQARRLTAFRGQVRRQRPDLSASEIERTAQAYVEASDARIDGELRAARQRLSAASATATVGSLRAALRAVADAAAVNAEDLALLAGVSLSAAQGARDAGQREAGDDGRLATPHRLFSAIATRLVVLPGGGGAVAIALAAPGAWRPEAPRAGRSSMSHEEIRALAKRGESLAGIARAAGVSRQRVHAIVKSS